MMRLIFAVLVSAPVMAQAAFGGLFDVPDESPDFPGQTTRVVDPYGRTNAPNPLFLTSLPGKLWWDEEAAGRLPVLVTEPVGLTRWSQPVSVIQYFPAGTVPASIRVVTPYGREIASQVRVLDAQRQSFEIVFLIDRLDAWSQVPLFIYYGSMPLTRPPQHAPDLCLRIEERAESMVLVNNRLQAEFSKRVGQDKYLVWRSLKGQGTEYNMIGSYPVDFDPNQEVYGVSYKTPVQVVENGPIRKTIAYGNPWGEEGYTVSLYADSPLVYLTGKASARTANFWLPGGDTLNDVLAYESNEGLKRMPIQYRGANTPPRNYDKLKDWFSQGWFALLDEVQQQGLGWFFDLPGHPWIQTVSYGYWVTPSASGQNALYVASDARSESCRQAYIAWKCPPIVSRGENQPFTKIEPRVPRLGQDFIRMHFRWGRHHPRMNTNTARDCVQETYENGANYLFFSPPTDACLAPSRWPDGEPGPALFDELARECHARGMGLAGYTRFELPRIRDMIHRGLDCAFLADEMCWHPEIDYYPLNAEARKQYLAGTGGWGHTNFSAEERADFRKRYGADMPDEASAKARADDVKAKLDPDHEGTLYAVPTAPAGRFPGLVCNNLNDPSQLALFRMKIDANNLFMGDAADVARQANSNILVTTVTSPRQLSIPGESSAFADFETWAGFFSTVCLDLYENDGNWLNGLIKYARGAQGNRRPLLIISGYAAWDELAPVELNQHLQVMYGANALCFFSSDRVCTPAPLLGAKNAFEFIDYTGLGDFVAQAWPLEFVGVLRDRDEFFASLARKETLNVEGFGSLYEQSIYQTVHAIAVAFYIPVNVISAKRLKTELQSPYKMIVVPNNPTLSDANAALLRNFVEAGGHLIVECATVQNKTIAELAGVSISGDEMSGAIQMTGVKPPLEGWSANLTCAWQPVKVRDGVEILATAAHNQPAITRAAAGKGKVIYFAPRVGPQAARSDRIGLALRLLVEHTIGYVPVRNDLPGAWTTVLTDGERFVISAFNGSDKPRNEMTLTLNGFPNTARNLVSMRTGRSYPIVNGKARNLLLTPQQPDYFMLASTMSMPKAYVQKAAPISQSQKPGMAFLNLPPLPSREFQARLAQKRPDTIYVGVLAARPNGGSKAQELGAHALASALGNLGQVKAELISNLEADAIGFYDVLAIPNLVTPFTQPNGWEKNVRAYVEQGGSALLMGRSVGYGAVRAMDLFPEVGQPSELVAYKTLQVTRDHPVTSASAFQARFHYDLNNPAFAEQYNRPAMKPGDLIEAGFPEFVILQPGPAGTAVAATTDKAEAVIVAGNFGKGRVVLSGMTFGCRQTGDGQGATYEEALSFGEQMVLINSIYWLGERGAAAAEPADTIKPAKASERKILTTQDQKTEELLLLLE